MRLRRDERGQVLVVTALCISALIAFVGLATDVGLLFRAKRNVQIAADAAATAGALDYMYNVSATSAQTAAQTASTQNGITNGTNGAVVTVNIPPLGGYHKSTGYVEVVINQPNPTYFMKLFSFNTVSVAARAVAGTPGPSSQCVTVTDPTASGAMTLQGSFDVTASKCSIAINSNSSDALQFTGGGGTLTAGSVGVVGGAGGHTGDSTPAPVTGIPPVSDPLKNIIVAPSLTSCTYTSSATSVTQTDPAATVGGVVCFTRAVTLNNVTNLASGTYIFENGVTLSGNVTSGTGGTMFDIYGGDLNITTGTVFNLSEPTSGAYKGIVLMDPQSGGRLTFQIGNACGSMTGIIYAPKQEFYMNDSGGDAKCGGLNLTTDLVVGTLFDKTATLTITPFSATHPTLTPLLVVSLVE